LIDYLSRERVIADDDSSRERIRDGYCILERKRIHEEGRRVIKRVIIRREGNGAPLADYEERVNLYRAEELHDLLENAGIRVRREWGDYHGAAFDPRTSERTILLGFKESA
jgi:hypothetical protein